jgi:hypothetical protein
MKTNLKPGEFLVTVECEGERDDFHGSQCGQEGDGVLYQRTGRIDDGLAAFEAALDEAARIEKAHLQEHRGAHGACIEATWPHGDEGADKAAVEHGFALMPANLQRFSVTVEREPDGSTTVHVNAKGQPDEPAGEA